MRVVVVANAPLRVPSDTRVELTVYSGFGAVDDWIAKQSGLDDIVVTADIPLAGRCLAKGAQVFDPKDHPFEDNEISAALATRELREGLRHRGIVTGGPVPMTPKDRSRFLSKLDKAVPAARHASPPRP